MYMNIVYRKPFETRSKQLECFRVLLNTIAMGGTKVVSWWNAPEVLVAYLTSNRKRTKFLALEVSKQRK